MKVITTLAMLWIALLIMATSALAQTAVTKASPEQMVDALHSAFGKHPNARAVHAKGIILKGTFSPDPEAKKISKALHFRSFATEVTFRFSDFTGIPDIPDTLGAANPRGLAIKFHLSDGSSTDIVSHSFDGFPVATTDEFREFLLAISKSGPEVAHPSPIEDFLAAHPVAKSFVSNQKRPSTSYSTLNYYGVNTFRFTNDSGVTHLIRYQFIPMQG
ncbi:MAG: catalase, partial [Chryseobacterium sp.]